MNPSSKVRRTKCLTTRLPPQGQALNISQSLLALQNPIIPPIMPLLIQKHFLFKSIFSPSINTILSTKVAGIVGKPRIPRSFPCRISGSNKSIHRKITVFFTNSLFQLYYNGPSEVNTWKKMKNSNFLASLSRDLLNQKYLSRDLLNQKYHAQCNPKLISFHHQHWFGQPKQGPFEPKVPCPMQPKIN